MIDRNIDDSIIDYIPISAFDVDNISQRKVINNNNLSMKEHIKSFVITFVAGFAIVLVSQINDITLETISSGAIWGVLFGAVRAGFKGVLELFIALYSRR